MRDLVIIGTGGFAREVHQIVEDITAAGGPWRFVGFLDGNASRHGTTVHGHTVLGPPEWLLTHSETAAVVAIGNPAVKRRIALDLTTKGFNNFATLVHPRAWIGNRVELGPGTIVCAGTCITTDIKIGSHVILNLCCTVGHDTEIEDYVTVAPGANISGAVRLEEGVDLGTNCTIIQGLAVRHWSVVGAGAVVVREIPANVTAVGAPAKPIKERTEGWHLVS